MNMTPPIRILLVEDEPHDRLLVQNELEKSGLHFETRCVDTPEDFLANLESFAPDLIISDQALSNFMGSKSG